MDLEVQMRRDYNTGYVIDPFYDTPEWRLLRHRTLSRDKNICQYCGSLAHQADHVIPRRRGGKDHLRNLVASCHHCNKTALNHTFKTFKDKKTWILKTRGIIHVDPPTVILKKPKVIPALKPTKRGLLRSKLAQKNNPDHYKEEKLLQK